MTNGLGHNVDTFIERSDPDSYVEIEALRMTEVRGVERTCSVKDISDKVVGMSWDAKTNQISHTLAFRMLHTVELSFTSISSNQSIASQCRPKTPRRRMRVGTIQCYI